MVTLIINLFISLTNIVEYNLNTSKKAGIIYMESCVFVKTHRIFIDLIEFLDLGFVSTVKEENDYVLVKIIKETYFVTEIVDILDFLFDTKDFIAEKLKVLEILNSILDQRELIYQLSDPANYNEVLSRLKEG